MLLEDAPVPALENRMDKASAYFLKHKRNYFDDLIATEKKKAERYIGSNEVSIMFEQFLLIPLQSVHVISTYSPRGFNEIELIIPGVSAFTSLSDKQIGDFADALIR